MANDDFRPPDDSLAKAGGDSMDRMRRNRMRGGVSVKDWGALGKLVGGLENLDGVLNGIGAMLTGRTQSAFRSQGRSGQWPERSTPNIAGVLRDLEAGGAPKTRRWDDRPALQDTGRLKGSWSWRIVANDAVEVGTTVPYARKHQEGGAETLSVTAAMKQRLAKWLKRRKDERAESLRWLLDVDQVDIKIPQRVMLEITPQDKQDILAAVKRALGVR
jgi:phage gpG-like protein